MCSGRVGPTGSGARERAVEDDPMVSFDADVEKRECMGVLAKGLKREVTQYIV